MVSKPVWLRDFHNLKCRFKNTSLFYYNRWELVTWNGTNSMERIKDRHKINTEKNHGARAYCKPFKEALTFKDCYWVCCYEKHPKWMKSSTDSFNCGLYNVSCLHLWPHSFSLAALCHCSVLACAYSSWYLKNVAEGSLGPQAVTAKLCQE